MNNIIVFVHIGANHGITEVNLPERACLADAYQALRAANIEIDGESCLFIDEDDHSYHGDESVRLESLKHGSHIHLCRCRAISTTVNYLDKSEERKFAPGTRVRRVKAWAVRHFEIEATDAGEHILRLCDSTEEPPTDTPLHELTEAPQCCVCFDLVPEKRVEG